MTEQLFAPPDEQLREIEEYYDHHFFRFDQIRRHLGPWGAYTYHLRCRLIREAIQQHCGSPRPDIVVLGCGGWDMTHRLSNLGPATGVDLSVKAIQTSAQRWPGCRFIHGDITEYVGPPERFDAAVCAEVIEHVLEERRPQLMEVIHTLLRPGGIAIFTTPDAAVQSEMGIESEQLYDHPLSESEFRALLGDKMEILEFRHFCFDSRHLPIRLLWRLLWPLNAMLDRGLTRRRGKYMIAVLRKR